MSTNASTSTVKFLTISEFKIANGLNADEKAQVVKNPNTQKLFVSIGSKAFKCQQDINPAKEMKFLVDNDNLAEACLTNVKASAENIMFEL